MPPATDAPSITPSTFSVTVLGSGTSTGVPSIACVCSVCTSSDPRNKRLRPSIIVRVPQTDGTEKIILVDTTPDMRTQVLREGIDHVDAVLITHTHADHIFGMDDLRQYNFIHQNRIPVYGTADVLEHLRTVFFYCFRETQAGGGKPQLDLIEFRPYEALEIAGLSILPMTVLHGSMPVTAFKFGKRFAYVTDVSELPGQTMPHLVGLDTLILDAVRPEPHPTHFGLYQALDVVRMMKPRQTYLTHLSHLFDYATTMSTLPADTALAYDGLTFTVPVS